METEKLMILGGSTRPGSIGQMCQTIDTMAAGPLYRIMVDCGMEFIREDDLGLGGIGPVPDFSLLEDGKKIDAVFLTHAHVDHIGGIGALCGSGYLSPEARIYCSPQTAQIVPIVLNDGLKGHPSYNIFDAADAINRLTVIPKPGEFEILPKLKVHIVQRGHIPGNAGIDVPFASGEWGYITSDECWQNQPVSQASRLLSQCGAPIPSMILSTDLTYGRLADKKDFYAQLSIEEKVDIFMRLLSYGISEGRKQIVGAFGVGRSQNLAKWCADAGIRCYIDGVGRHIHRIFQENRWSERDNLLPKLGENSGIVPVESAKHREHLIRSSEPCVVITTGGMGDFGPIVAYKKAGISSQKYDFHFTSWLAPGSDGEKLVKASEKTRIVGKRRNVRLRVGENAFEHFSVVAQVYHTTFSGHSPMEHNVDFLQDIVNCRHGKELDRVILTHGAQENKATAAKMFLPFSRQIMYGERNTVITLS